MEDLLEMQGNSSTEIISSLESRYITLLEAKVTQLESHFKKGRIEPDNSDKVCRALFA